MSPEAYADYVAKCKEFGIKPTPKEDLRKCTDPEKTRFDREPPLQVCSHKKPKQKEEPMPQKYNNNQAADLLGVNVEEIPGMRIEAGLTTRGNLSENQMNILREHHGTSPKPEAPEKDAETTAAEQFDEAMETHAPVIVNRFETAPDDRRFILTKAKLVEFARRVREQTIAEYEGSLDEPSIDDLMQEIA